MLSRAHEFFEEGGVGSMSRMIAFIGAVTTAAGVFICLVHGEYGEAATFAGILAGLSGVNYGVNRMSEAYETARIGRTTTEET